MPAPFSLWFESDGATRIATAPALFHHADYDGRVLGVLAVMLTVRYQRAHEPIRVDEWVPLPLRLDEPYQPRPVRDPADLDRAIAAARDALTRLPAGDADQDLVCTTLATALALRYELRGDLAELGEALALARTPSGVDRQPAVDAARGTMLAWAAHAYATRRLDRRDLRGQNLSGRDLRDADLGRADLTGASLADTDLTGANLAGAILTDTRLDRACLHGAVLSGADLTRTWLINADLTDAHLTGAILDRTVLARATIDAAALTSTRCRRAIVTPKAPTWTPACEQPESEATLVAAVDDLVATCHEDRSVRLWDAATGMLLHESSGAGVDIGELAFSPDGGRLGAAWQEGGDHYFGEGGRSIFATVWSLGLRWDESWQTAVPDDYDWSEAGWQPQPMELVFSPDSRWVAFGAHYPPAPPADPGPNPLCVSDAASGEILWSLTSDTDRWHRGIAWSADSRLVAAGCVDPVLGQYSVAVRHAETGTPAAYWPTGSEEVLAVTFADAGLVRATTRGRQRWSAWQWPSDATADGELWHHDGTIGAAVYSPDGGQLAVATRDRVIVYDAATGAQIWSTAARAVTELRFAPDGRWLVRRIAGAGQAVRIHDAGTGRPLPGVVRSVAFTPYGYWAIQLDGTVHLHGVDGSAIRDLDPYRASREGWLVAGHRLLRPDDLAAPPS